MNTVKQLLNAKGREVFQIGPDSSVFEALKVMTEKGVGALVVMDGKRLAGVISERDYARNVVLKGRSSERTAVKEIMTTNVCCARLDQTVEQCMALMTDKHIRHLPVLDGNELAGLISIGDLVKAVIAEQKFIIEQLENYIVG